MAGHIILAGDIGATKTTLALFGSARRPLQEQTYRNKKFTSFHELLSLFVQTVDTCPHQACFGVAGPVRNNHVHMTNLDWTIDGHQLADQLGIREVLLVNDLVATTAGALTLPASSLEALNRGTPTNGGTVAVIAPGTGLGEAFAAQTSQGFCVLPSEGGHCTFAPRNALQIQLLQWMLTHNKTISVEQVCSGQAIPQLYQFIHAHGCPQPDWMAKLLEAASEPGAVIVAQATKAIEEGEACETAVRTMHLFTDILATEAANLALKVLATGGVYLGGGMTPRLLPFLESQRFMAFFSHGVYHDLLANTPVNIILDPRTALIGAREIARRSKKNSLTLPLSLRTTSDFA